MADSNPDRQLKVLFVCTANICRSPAAQAVMESLVEAAGLAGLVGVDSAGTSGARIGELPDARMTAAAAARHYKMAHRARKLRDADFREFDCLVAMDRDHLASLRRAAQGIEHGAAVSLLLDYCPDSEDNEVRDPYFGDASDFEEALDAIEKGCAALLAAVRVRLENGKP